MYHFIQINSTWVPAYQRTKMLLQGLRYASSCIMAGLPAAITLCRGQDLGPTSSSSPSSFPFASPASSSSSSSPRPFPDTLETAREHDISFYTAPGGTYDTKTQEPYPIIRRAAVREHNSEESVWVIYKDGVYDITNFVSQKANIAAHEARFTAMQASISRLAALLVSHDWHHC